MGVLIRDVAVTTCDLSEMRCIIKCSSQLSYGIADPVVKKTLRAMHSFPGKFQKSCSLLKHFDNMTCLHGLVHITMYIVLVVVL